ncbi:MAG TPA: glycosyltransferase [Solirubrobacteraceae bacterium]|jgi:glycosyltransferase involved in cell wall biosynthesis|nr:glycosyltransferase [Solirubrobacteraceae bacterium]
MFGTSDTDARLARAAERASSGGADTTMMPLSVPFPDPRPGCAAMTARRPSVCLCMIVRDEIDVLERCLDSCRELIDRWVICDTGSTDGTQDLIRRKLDGIPGELHEHDWVDFGHNRSELMRLARAKADYLLLLDADTTIEADPRALEKLEADSYLLCHADGIRHYTKRLVSGRLDWRYVGVVHEYITCDEDHRTERLDDVIIRSWSVGGSRKGRWRRDAELLEAEIERDPADARAVFYLAQTYRDIGEESDDRAELALALAHYQRRAEMGGWVEEAYFARYQVGVLSARLGDWPRAVDAFLTAWEQRPARLEAVYDLAVGLRERGLHRAAHQFTRLAAGLGPLPVPEDILFVAPWIYEWGMLFEYSITAYWCGELGTSVAACKRLLAIRSLPEPHRRQTSANLRHAFGAIARQAAEQPPLPPRRLPHTGIPTRGRPAPGS